MREVSPSAWIASGGHEFFLYCERANALSLKFSLRNQIEDSAWHGRCRSIDTKDNLNGKKVQSEGFEERCAGYAPKKARHASIWQIWPQSKECEASDRNWIITGAAKRRQSTAQERVALCFQQSSTRTTKNSGNSPGRHSSSSARSTSTRSRSRRKTSSR
jgi:hypothetical protein